MEYDGKQHFEFPNVFHRTRKEFDEYRQADIEKSKAAISNGYILIRITHSDLNDVKHILGCIFNSNYNYYFSDPSEYDYIISNL